MFENLTLVVIIANEVSIILLQHESKEISSFVHSIFL